MKRSNHVKQEDANIIEEKEINNVSREGCKVTDKFSQQATDLESQSRISDDEALRIAENFVACQQESVTSPPHEFFQEEDILSGNFSHATEFDATFGKLMETVNRSKHLAFQTEEIQSSRNGCKVEPSSLIEQLQDIKTEVSKDHSSNEGQQNKIEFRSSC